MNHLIFGLFKRSSGLALFGQLLFCSFCWSDTATIATASNFKPAMTKLIQQFEATHPHQITQINASSGILFNQIIYGAPFDAFLSADSRYPNELELSGAGVSQTRFTYAQGQLAIAFAQPQQVNLTKDFVLKQLQKRLSNNEKIAIPNPLIAPYGRAAQQTLEYLQLWQPYQQQLVRGANVAQSYQFIVSANVSMGFAARAQLIDHSLSYWPIPGEWHQPIRQQAILLQFGQQNNAALAFLAFLASEPAKTIIRNNGYTVTD